jgi:hypothetical protein
MSLASSDLKIVRVEGRKLHKQFLQVPWEVYKNDPLWIPPLLMAVDASLDLKKNPFYKHARMERWIAFRGTTAIGRMAAVVDDAHNQFHEERTAYWGFFECTDDVEAAVALFSAAELWARGQGMKCLRGPMNPSTNYECGMQVSAFETKPYIMMTQNPEYYMKLVEAAGCSKAKDLLAWEINGNTTQVDPRLVKFAKRLEDRQGVKIRSVNMKDFDGEIERIFAIYNDAWEKNWGFVPMTKEEFKHMAKDLKGIVVPEMLYIAELKGEPIAFSLWLPDLNMVMEKIPSGRLLPTGLFKLLWYTKINKRFVNRGRVLTLGVKQKYRALGIAPAMYLRYISDGPRYGYPIAECSWILEDNKPMNEGLKLMGAQHYKTYRIYDKLLT